MCPSHMGWGWNWLGTLPTEAFPPPAFALRRFLRSRMLRGDARLATRLGSCKGDPAWTNSPSNQINKVEQVGEVKQQLRRGPINHVQVTFWRVWERLQAPVPFFFSKVACEGHAQKGGGVSP